jgi:ribosome-binding ATPase YchF (GTP1/OBG family)
MAVLRELDYSTDPGSWDDDDREELARLLRERTKPIVVVANKADIAPDENIERLEEAAGHVIPCTAEGELALRQAVEAGVINYDPGDEDFEITGDISGAQEEGLNRIRDVMGEWGGTGVQQSLDESIYDLLDRITVYPVQNETRWTDGQGNVLPDAFLLAENATPKDLAFAVHSDIGEGYLHAVDAREKRRIGEDHELDEGDVVKIVSTAS